LSQIKNLILEISGDEFKEEIEVFENGFKKKVTLDMDEGDKIQKLFKNIVSKDQCLDIFRDVSTNIQAK
jgi:hypothetical protein